MKIKNDYENVLILIMVVIFRLSRTSREILVVLVVPYNPFLSCQLCVVVCTPICTYLSLLLFRKICRRTEAPGVWVDCFDKSIFTVQVVLSKGTAGIQCDSSVVRRQCDTTLHTILKIQTCRTSRLNYKSALSPSSIYSQDSNRGW